MSAPSDFASLGMKFAQDFISGAHISTSALFPDGVPEFPGDFFENVADNAAKTRKTMNYVFSLFYEVFSSFNGPKKNWTMLVSKAQFNCTLFPHLISMYGPIKTALSDEKVDDFTAVLTVFDLLDTSFSRKYAVREKSSKDGNMSFHQLVWLRSDDKEFLLDKAPEARLVIYVRTLLSHFRYPEEPTPLFLGDNRRNIVLRLAQLQSADDYSRNLAPMYPDEPMTLDGLFPGLSVFNVTESLLWRIFDLFLHKFIAKIKPDEFDKKIKTSQTMLDKLYRAEHKTKGDIPDEESEKILKNARIQALFDLVAHGKPAFQGQMHSKEEMMTDSPHFMVRFASASPAGMDKKEERHPASPAFLEYAKKYYGGKKILFPWVVNINRAPKAVNESSPSIPIIPRSSAVITECTISVYWGNTGCGVRISYANACIVQDAPLPVKNGAEQKIDPEIFKMRSFDDPPCSSSSSSSSKRPVPDDQREEPSFEPRKFAKKNDDEENEPKLS